MTRLSKVKDSRSRVATGRSWAPEHRAGPRSNGSGLYPLPVQIEKMVVRMTLIRDSMPIDRSIGRQAPRVHVASAFAAEVDAARRVPADVSIAIHKFMQIDEQAFCRALLSVNQGKLSARHVHSSRA